MGKNISYSQPTLPGISSELIGKERGRLVFCRYYHNRYTHQIVYPSRAKVFCFRLK